MTDVPDGTITQVLEWVGDDPGRARAALDAEYDGQMRTTLISQLETIAAKEATAVTDEPATTEAEAETDMAPGPQQPDEVELYPADEGVVVGHVHRRNEDVAADDITAGLEADDAIESELVDSIQVIGASNGCIIAINGTAYGFGVEMLAALKGAVDRAVAGSSL